MLRLYLLLVSLMRKIPYLRGAVWKARCACNALLRVALVGRPLVDGNQALAAAIMNKTPFAAGKMGSTEAAALHRYLKRAKVKKTGKTPPPYHPYVFHTLFVNSGVFPQTEEMYDLFCEKYLHTVMACDALVAWDVAGEAVVFGKYCKQTMLVTFASLEPFFSKALWTRALEGKKVLVISPFSESIEKQYARIDRIWGEKKVLPAFELLTIRAPLSAGLVASDKPDWFAALDGLKACMDAVDYDVVLIGAGAFSLPLAVHAKSRGKVGIHLGGSVQILFGIIGRRWAEMPEFMPFFNEYWVAPADGERPTAYLTNEGGCYW